MNNFYGSNHQIKIILIITYNTHMTYTYIHITYNIIILYINYNIYNIYCIER